MKANKIDYRFFEWETVPSFVNNRSDLKSLVLKKHPRVKNFYSFFRKEHYLFYRYRFNRLFSYRCCYCGVSFNKTLNDSNIQIDHIFSESFRKTVSDFDFDAIENLAPSCSVCNRRKSDIVNSEMFYKKISPFTCGSIFERDSNLYIRICKSFSKDKDIVGFYNKLQLSSEFYRLAYFYEYFVEWMNKSRILMDINMFFKFFVISILLGEVVRSNANYR